MLLAVQAARAALTAGVAKVLPPRARCCDAGAMGSRAGPCCASGRLSEENNERQQAREESRKKKKGVEKKGKEEESEEEMSQQRKEKRIRSGEQNWQERRTGGKEPK